MIIISGTIISLDDFVNQYSVGPMERKILEILTASEFIYSYRSMDYLKFELDLRVNIIQAAKDLYKSKMDFKTFRQSICNPDFWERSEEGGFSVKNGVLPSDAIEDIFINGPKYGTECATAIIIVYYKALLNILPKKLFNELFSEIYLMNWKSLDTDLGVTTYKKVPDYLPGDCRYIDNPDVDPLTPHWQGENVIDLGNGTYYGHGIGIGTADKIIEVLEKYRKAEATQPARLLDSVTTPDFKYLAHRYLSFVGSS
ncbi:MAG: protein-glutamine gamma-glutamyltransferase [Anaerosolibacter sp.]|jgi:protein-glutamine gamma-glutamyltransferase|uniref:protein-glutamine gamma-glutamyltransferase n=1 Tax=Anaerosolibacter sp. TaxID=1872527 RepID=UPI0026228414|nr:protein-glutamine gamma-glutamyltransferase [Anaerosolibacter sp.]MDF2545358.1 protein-glutamine gamma-glutamyltransferase [Anaerosolibacter sp.]